MIKSEAIVGVPNMVFKTRVRDESISGDNPYRWQDVSTDELFGGKKILLFSLPGAFTPTCSTFQLPDYEKMYDEFIQAGVDDVCLLYTSPSPRDLSTSRMPSSA